MSPQAAVPAQLIDATRERHATRVESVSLPPAGARQETQHGGTEGTGEGGIRTPRRRSADDVGFEADDLAVAVVEGLDVVVTVPGGIREMCILASMMMGPGETGQLSRVMSTRPMSRGRLIASLPHPLFPWLSTGRPR